MTMTQKKRTKPYGKTLLVENGEFQRNAPTYSEDNRYVVAIYNNKRLRPATTKNQTPYAINTYLYPSEEKMPSLSGATVNDLIENRVALVKAIPQGFCNLAIIDTKPENKPVIVNLYIAENHLHTITETLKSYPKQTTQTLHMMEHKGYEVDGNHLIMRIRSTPYSIRPVVFNYKDNAVILDRKTGKVLYAGNEALENIPMLKDMAPKYAAQQTQPQAISTELITAHQRTAQQPKTLRIGNLKFRFSPKIG